MSTKRRTRSAALLDEQLPEKGASLRVDDGVRELGAMQASNPAAFAELMDAAMKGEDVNDLWSSVQEQTPELGDLLQQKPRGNSIEIRPVPGFVVKTRGKKRVQGIAEAVESKYFLNVCSHEAVGELAMAKQLDDQGKEVEGVRVPVSIGPEREDEDNKGDKCFVIDCVVNPKVLEGDRDALCDLAIAYAEQKYELELDRKFKLPRLKYKGSQVVSQWIRDDSKRPTITEVEETPQQPVRAELGPGADLVRVAVDGVDWDVADEPQWPTVGPGSALLVELATPCDWRRAGALSHSVFAVQAKLAGRKVARFALPLAVVANSARLTLSKRDGLNVARLDFVVDQTLTDRPDPGSKPWLVAAALSSGGDDAPDHDATADRYHLDAKRQDEIAPLVERPPTGASAAEIAYAAAHAARVAAELADATGDDEQLPEDKFHKADIVSQHYIAQREAQASKKKEEARATDKAAEPDVEYLDIDKFRHAPSPAPLDDDAPPSLEVSEPAPPTMLPAPSAVLAANAPDLTLASDLWAELL